MALGWMILGKEKKIPRFDPTRYREGVEVTKLHVVMGWNAGVVVIRDFIIPTGLILTYISFFHSIYGALTATGLIIHLQHMMCRN